MEVTKENMDLLLEEPVVTVEDGPFEPELNHPDVKYNKETAVVFCMYWDKHSGKKKRKQFKVDKIEDRDIMQERVDEMGKYCQ